MTSNPQAKSDEKGHKLRMFDKAQLEHAIDMQQRSYRLLKWLADAVRHGLIIRFDAVHSFTSLPEGASHWFTEHLQNIPPDARPEPQDVPVFANFFSTYLENSFDLDPAPGKRLYSPNARCFCPVCSWLGDAPNLQAKKLRSADKKRANRMRVDAIQNLALELGLVISDADVEQVLADDSNFRYASLLAYGLDLFCRLGGIANGPAVLALWRGFAWNRSGSPIQSFRLTAALMMEAEVEIIRCVRQWDTTKVR